MKYEVDRLVLQYEFDMDLLRRKAETDRDYFVKCEKMV